MKTALSILCLASVGTLAHSQGESVPFETTSVVFWGILGLLVVIALWLVLREFWCWFYKINEIRDLLKELVRLTANQQQAPGQQQHTARTPFHPSLDKKDDPQLAALLSKLEREKSSKKKE